jgi:hypothetical protein
MRKPGLLGWVCLFGMSTVPASAADIGTRAAEFLKVGIGPRAVAMADAQVGLADDVYAAYWNPAGLAQLQIQEAGFVQNQYLENISEQYAAYAFPHASWGTFAGSFTFLHIGTFQGYDAAGLPSGSVGASDAALTASYARTYFLDRRMGSGLAVGLTAKYIEERLDSVRAGAYAGDLGVLFIPGKKWGDPLDGWKGGIVMRNLGTPLQFDRESFHLPQSIEAGLSYSGVWRNEVFTLTLDGRQPDAGPRSWGSGLELKTLQVLVARAGYTSEGDLGGLRLGGGIRFKTMQVDYAYAAAGAFGAAHRIGLTLRFGKMPEDPQYTAQRWYEKGMRNYRRQRYTDALVEFNKALEIDPAHPDALKMMQQAYEDIQTQVPE